MSDWWQRRLGSAPAHQPSTPPVPQAIPPHQRPMTQVPQQYAPAEQVTYQQPPAPAEDPNGESHIGDLLRTKEYREVPREAKAHRRHDAGLCPECGSGNFFDSGTPGRPHQHCYDCGYPIIQAGSGAGALGGAGLIASGGTHAAQSPAYPNPNALG